MDELIKCHDGYWNLYYVSGTEGRNSDHFFKKLLLIPRGAKGYGKERCKKVHGWSYEAQWDSSSESAEVDLQDLLETWQTHDGYEVCHVHVGIHMESCCVGKGYS